MTASSADEHALRVASFSPASQVAAPRRGDEVVLLAQLAVPGSQCADALFPRVAFGTPALAGASVVLEHVLRYPEVLGRHAEDLLDLRDLVGAERTAVRVRGVGVLR
jgi:hypothetical protein